MTGVLSGLRVVELAGVLAGPSVGQFLAELGADVLKVENARTGGDVTRTWRLASEADPAAPEASGGGGRPAYFSAANWGKRSVALDLSHEGGREALHALVRGCDVVLTASRPGSAARLGADAATLRALAPRAVVVSLTGYGPGDPRAGYDAVVQAESGFMHLNGPAHGATAPEASGGPTKMPVALVDVLAAHQIKEGVLAALLRRERSGEGALVEVSLLGAAAASLANQGTAWLQAAHEPRPMGSAHPQIAPYGEPLATATGPVVLAVGTDRQFAALCDVLGLPLAGDVRFATNPARVRHREALTAALQDALAAWDRDALLAALGARAVPAGAVRRVSEAFGAPEAQGVVLRAGPLAGLRQAAFTVDGAAPDPRPLRPPPRYAEHTGEVLLEAGAAPEAVAGWLASGAAVDRSAPEAGDGA